MVKTRLYPSVIAGLVEAHRYRPLLCRFSIPPRTFNDPGRQLQARYDSLVGARDLPGTGASQGFQRGGKGSRKEAIGERDVEYVSLGFVYRVGIWFRDAILGYQ